MSYGNHKLPDLPAEPPTPRPAVYSCDRCHDLREVGDLARCLRCEKRICFGCADGAAEGGWCTCAHCAADIRELEAGQQAVLELSQLQALQGSLRRNLLVAAVAAAAGWLLALAGWVL